MVITKSFSLLSITTLISHFPPPHYDPHHRPTITHSLQNGWDGVPSYLLSLY